MCGESTLDFLNALSSKEPVPGGGGASALVGALGIALGSMVGNLTLGKKKYENVQEDIRIILQKAESLRLELYGLIAEDAKVFEPLSGAYGLPRNTEAERAKRDEIMEEALCLACSVPQKIMEKSLEAIILHEELAQKGTRFAISDIGVGVIFCKSALMGAGLNVLINTKLMKNRKYAAEVNRQLHEMLAEGINRADKVYKEVESMITN